MIFLILNLVSANILKYRDGLFVGAGIESSDASVHGSPFDPSSVTLNDQELSMEGKLTIDMAKNAEEMASILTSYTPITVDRLFGVSADVDFNFDKKYSLKSDSVVALIRHEVKKS